MSRFARPLHPLALSVAMAFAAVPLTIHTAWADESSHFSIPAGDLSQALNGFAEQAGLVLAFDPALTRGKRSSGLNGQLRSDGGLAELLGGNGLRGEAMQRAQ